MKKFLLALFIFAVFFLGSAYYLERDGSQQQGGTNPDSIFYYADIALEWVQLNLLTWNEEKKLELRMSFMQERLNELKDLDRLKQLTHENVARIEKRYAALADDAQDALKRQMQKAGDAQVKLLLEEVRAVTQKQRDALADIAKQTPTSTENILDDAMQTATDAYRRATEILQNR